MALQEDIRSLAQLPPFAELEPDAVRLIALSAETRILRAGTVLFRKGEAADGGVVVLSGSIALSEGLGRTQVVRPPALIGQSALLTETTRPADAEVRSPASVLRIPRVLFRRVLSEYPASAARLRRAWADRLLALQSEYDQLLDALAS